MAWWYLIGAGLLEILWASSLKFTEGFTRLWPDELTQLGDLLVWKPQQPDVPCR